MVSPYFVLLWITQDPYDTKKIHAPELNWTNWRKHLLANFTSQFGENPKFKVFITTEDHFTASLSYLNLFPIIMMDNTCRSTSIQTIMSMRTNLETLWLVGPEPGPGPEQNRHSELKRLSFVKGSLPVLYNGKFDQAPFLNTTRYTNDIPRIQIVWDTINAPSSSFIENDKFINLSKMKWMESEKNANKMVIISTDDWTSSYNILSEIHTVCVFDRQSIQILKMFASQYAYSYVHAFVPEGMQVEGVVCKEYSSEEDLLSKLSEMHTRQNESFCVKERIIMRERVAPLQLTWSLSSNEDWSEIVRTQFNIIPDIKPQPTSISKSTDDNTDVYDFLPIWVDIWNEENISVLLIESDNDNNWNKSLSYLSKNDKTKIFSDKESLWNHLYSETESFLSNESIAIIQQEDFEIWNNLLSHPDFDLNQFLSSSSKVLLSDPSVWKSDDWTKTSNCLCMFLKPSVLKSISRLSKSDFIQFIQNDKTFPWMKVFKTSFLNDYINVQAVSQNQKGSSPPLPP